VISSLQQPNDFFNLFKDICAVMNGANLLDFVTGYISEWWLGLRHVHTAVAELT